MPEERELTGEHLRWLRELAKEQQIGRVTQARFANLLGVTTRTLTKWENGNLTVPFLYLPTIQLLFEKYCLIPFATAIAQRAFEEVCKSEFVALWFVRYTHTALEGFHSTEAVLLEDTARFQCLCGEEEKQECTWSSSDCTDKHYCYRTDRQTKPLTQRSLTTVPLRSGRIEKLAGDQITNSKHKRMRGRTNHFYRDHLVHTLLHVPLLIEGPDHPQSVALLSMENKLGGENKNLKAEDAYRYTEEDERKAETLLRDAFCDKKWPESGESVRTQGHYSGNMVKHLHVFGYLRWLPEDLSEHEEGTIPEDTEAF